MKKALLLALLLIAGIVHAQTNTARMISGVNPQTGTSYTFQPSDVTKLVTFTNVGSVSVLLPSSNTSGYEAGRMFSAQNLGPGTVTITCEGCVIFSDVAAGSPTLVLTAGQGADIWADNLDANYSAEVGAGAGGGLAPSGVTPGTYTYTTLTVNQYGLITAASNGLAIGNESVTFTNSISATLVSTFANANVTWSCYDQLGIELLPSYVDVVAFPNITFNFVSPQSGTCVLNGNSGTGGGGGGTPGTPVNSCQYNVGNTGFGGALGCTVAPVSSSVNPALLSQDNTQNVVTVTSDFQNWTACASGCTYTINSPTNITAGANTFLFATVPVGVNGGDTIAAFRGHYLAIIPAAGDTSPVSFFPITGGTAVGGSTAGGTITGSIPFSYLAGYTIVSATSGMSEAISYASQISPLPGGITIKLDPTQTYVCSAPVYIFSNNLMQVFDGQGAMIQNSSFADCMTIYSTSTDFMHVKMQPTSTYWDVSPSSPSSIPGNSATATLTIPTCPANFYAAMPGQKLWLSGASGGMLTGLFGIGEYVFTTGGTCTPGLTNGTISITQGSPYILAPVATLAPHDAGYTLSSNVGSYIVDGSNFNVHIHDIRFLSHTTGQGQGNEIEVWQDQSCAIDNIDMDAGSVTRKDPDFQGSGIFNPVTGGICYVGPAVNISEPAHCIEWDGGNDISWTEGVCQNYSAGGVMIRHRLGGFGDSSIGPNVHFETGSSSPIWFGGVVVGNPLILQNGGISPLRANLNLGGGVPFGSNGSPFGPGFPPTLAGQTSTQCYYLVAHNNTSTSAPTCSTGGDCTSPPIVIGCTSNNNPAANPVTVSWYAWGDNSISGGCCTVSSYDLLAVTGSSGSIGVPFPQAPTGTGTFLVASGITPASACNTHAICSFVDNVAPGSRTSYTPNTSGTTPKAWNPPIYYLAGKVVLLNGATYAGVPTCINTNAYFSGTTGGTIQTVYPAVFNQVSLGLNDVNNECPYVIAPVSSLGVSGMCNQTSDSSGNVPCSANNGAAGFSHLHITIYTGRTSSTVTTTAVTPWSRFDVQQNNGLGTILGGAACDTAAHGPFMVTPTAGTGFVVTSSSAGTGGNNICLDITIHND